jgi:threonylcarbamoyladenosine tRNA methylthiotransferase MtaB
LNEADPSDLEKKGGFDSLERYSTISEPDMHKFKITTLGCKVNQSESDAIACCLKASEMIPIGKNQAADVCIVNTCAVTQKACMQSRQAIRQAIRSNPKAKIIVTGCYAQTAADEIKEIYGVQKIIGQAEKYKIPETIAREKGRQIDGAVSNNPKNFFNPIPLPGFGERTRPFLKIQDGCDAFCTFCIVPYARGPSCSLPQNEVLTNIEKLGQAGYREVVLAGIHLGRYGFDLSPRATLLELLQAIGDSKPVERVRLSSIEPCELNEDLINFVARSGPGPGSICHHFHIPLQSGDNEILKKMKRPYTRTFFRDLIVKTRKALPDAAIGVDVLIGFPGESQAAFVNTLSLIEKLPISYLHVFPFSARKGTPAYTFNDKVAINVIKNRCRKMRELGDFKKKVFYESFIGNSLETLVESKIDEKTGLIKGRTTNYIPILLGGKNIEINTLVNARIDTVDDDNLVYGTVCD